jgi:hypothetical protein
MCLLAMGNGHNDYASLLGTREKTLVTFQSTITSFTGGRLSCG